MVAEKSKANPTLYKEPNVTQSGLSYKNNPSEFYRIVCQTLLQYIFRRYHLANISKIIVVLDNLFTESKRKTITKSLKTYLKKYTQKPFYIYFHQSKADVNCQIADYCGWAIYVKNERQELRPMQQIINKVKSEFNIFARGTTRYY